MTVGVLGGGQLGRMLALAGIPLGLKFKFLDPSSGSPTTGLGESLTGSYDDMHLLSNFAQGLDVVTYEFENIPAKTIETIAHSRPVHPPQRALEISQDRTKEKFFFREHGIPTPAFVDVNSYSELVKAARIIGYPSILKTRTSGYDGKGQFILKHSDDIDTAWNSLHGVPSLLEQWIAFDRELSIIAVRGKDSSTVFYPLIENSHRNGILRSSLAPAPNTEGGLSNLAAEYAVKILDALNYVGTLTIELFQLNNQLIANEMAPRVHNSGHWTIEGAETSQFENHLRAIIGSPLGSATPRGYSAMVNIIGTIPDTQKILEVPGTHLHIYGKHPRPDRKLGHVTLRADRHDLLQEGLKKIRQLIQ